MIRLGHLAGSVAFAMATLWMSAPRAASAHTELIGAPVYAADGIEVGRVADVSTAGTSIDALRISRGAPLGLGERFVIIPQPAFMIRGKRVDLPDLRAEDVDLFPEASTLAPESGREDR